MTIGPLITAEHESTGNDYIQAGIDGRAEVLYDGSGDIPDEGNFLGLVVSGDMESDMTIAREEIIGPVLGLIRVPDFKSDIETVNASRFGNAASLFTDPSRKANRFRHNVKAENLGVNVRQSH